MGAESLPGQINALLSDHDPSDLELDMPVEPNTVIRLGAITKQFTAVAILLLPAESQLQDMIPGYLPDSPIRGCEDLPLKKIN